MSARSFNINKAKKYGNVRVIHQNKDLIVRLHQTDVVKLSDKLITLNTNGWHTVTTRTAINNALQQIGSPIRVFIKQGTMKVQFKNKIVDLVDGMTIALGA